MLWTYFPKLLVQIHGIVDSIKYEQIKKIKTWQLLLEILQLAVVGSSTRKVIQNKHQNQH